MGWVFLEKPLKKMAAFYETLRVIFIVTEARHWPVYWARWIHSIPSHPVPVKSLSPTPSRWGWSLCGVSFAACSGTVQPVESCQVKHEHRVPPPGSLIQVHLMSLHSGFPESSTGMHCRQGTFSPWLEEWACGRVTEPGTLRIAPNACVMGLYKATVGWVSHLTRRSLVM
jgi:hypothetical protein